MEKHSDHKEKTNAGQTPLKHPHKTIENPETGKITEGEIGSADRKSTAQNPERQKEEEKSN
jgi:hypothetical protein